MQRILAAITFCLLMPGCLMVQVGAVNPIPGLSKVAIVPFFNLSQEPSNVVDGRRFAMAYYSELQKTPGFDVIPVGVAEQAIVENQLKMNNPTDVLALANILGADAVVVGAVTDYNPYYPPRIGLKVSWYSNENWDFYPGVATDPDQRSEWNEEYKKDKKNKRKKMVDKVFDECNPWKKWKKEDEYHSFENVTYRGQTVESQEAESDTNDQSRFSVKRVVSKSKRIIPSFFQSKSAQSAGSPEPSQSNGTAMPPMPNSQPSRSHEPMPESRENGGGSSSMLSPELAYSSRGMSMQFDPRKPFMSYTRIFDGSDAELVASLSDYVELSGDQRSGGWEAYLHRSDDFIRFASHMMIVEMLSLHGGEGKRRWVIKLRKYR